MSRLSLGMLVSFCAIFVLLSYLAHYIPYFPLDLSVSLRIQEYDGLLYSIMYGVSFISSPLPATIIVISIAVWLAKAKRILESILIGSATALSSLAIVPLIKSLVDRPRPTADLIQVMISNGGESFPSGHAVYAVVFYGFLFYLLTNLFSRKGFVRTIRILLVVLIVLTMFSRIYLGAHWLSDVMGGFFLGVIILTCNIIVYRYCISRYRGRKRAIFKNFH
jgi:membrane-associated phospholipid phosphatase